MKKLGVRFYLNASASLMCLVGFIFLIAANLVRGYELPHFTLALISTILSFVLLVGSMVYSLFIKKLPFISVILQILSMLLAFLVLYIVISGSTDGIAALSTYDAYNTLLRQFTTRNVIGFAFLILEVILIIVSSFFKDPEAVAEQN